MSKHSIHTAKAMYRVEGGGCLAGAIIKWNFACVLYIMIDDNIELPGGFCLGILGI